MALSKLNAAGLALALASSLTLTGCGIAASSMMPAVGEDKLISRAEFATGLDKGQFTISDIEKSGQRTEFRVAANNGDNYRCYVTSLAGSFSTSDAICTKNGAPASEQPCDALSKAAGKCG